MTQHGRDQLRANWPDLYKPEQEATLPSEELLILKANGDYGWPECYHDAFQQRLVLAPEYGGDGGKAIGPCATKLAPLAVFPAHWAPNAMVRYDKEQFQAPYKNGVFIAFHGSWDRAPYAQGGYNVVFSRSMETAHPVNARSLRMVSRGRWGRPVKPSIVRAAWPWVQMVRSTSPTTFVDESTELTIAAVRTSTPRRSLPVRARRHRLGTSSRLHIQAMRVASASVARHRWNYRWPCLTSTTPRRAAHEIAEEISSCEPGRRSAVSILNAIRSLFSKSLQP